MDDNNIYSYSDIALVGQLGHFIKAARLNLNKSQQEIANIAGVDRTTVSLIENGKGGNLLTFIQLLRAVGQLPLLDHFKMYDLMSPILLAAKEKNVRYRATKSSIINKKNPKSDW